MSLNNIHCKQKFIGEEPQHPFSKIDFFSFPNIDFFSQFFPDFLPIFVIQKTNKVLFIKNTVDIKFLQESFFMLNIKDCNNHIFYVGQIYDAYLLLIDILSKAKKEMIIIDNYAGKKLFDIIRNINVKVKIYTENIDNISKEKYEKQYSNIEIINTNIFHDRFIIIDNKVLYHSGASFKDLGKKCFAITKIVDNNILEEL